MKFNTIDEHLIWTEEGFGNSAAIDIGGKIYVIDTMFNWELAQEWRSLIEQYFNEPVSGVIITHHHADHTYGNQVFVDLPIISSLEQRKINELWEKEIWPSFNQEDIEEWEENGYGVKNLQITHSNVCFENKLRLFGERTLNIIRADGHTLGSSYLWEPENKTLIAGDLIFNKQWPYGGDNTCDLITWQQVVESFIALNPRTIVSGHGPVATIKDLEEINDFLLNSIDFIRNNLEKGLNFQEIHDNPDFPDYYSQDRAGRKEITIERWVDFLTKNQD
jgi:glyoxylase-like metal-dependent hydrolase (beta-lactamase superfamily II)